MTQQAVVMTGASGRIGRAYFRAMSDTYLFTLVVNHAPEYAVPAPHHFICADLGDPTATENLIPRGAKVIHLAGIPDAAAVAVAVAVAAAGAYLLSFNHSWFIVCALPR